MTETVYRTGQAAKEWGVSSYEVRRLCEAGLIDAEFSAGKQWRIPASEVARIKREGVPPIPTTAEPEQRRSPQPAGRNTQGHRSEDLAEEDPEVVESAAAVKVKENTVRERKLDRELEETEDWFREREEREAEREAERETAERERTVRARAEQERREFTEEWLRYALRSVPNDAPAEVRLDVREQVEGLLATLPVSKKRQLKNDTDLLAYLIEDMQGGSTVERLVDGAVEKALKSWRRHKEAQRIIDRAIEDLPYGARPSWGEDTRWSAQARTATTGAVAKLPEAADTRAVEAAVAQAVAPIQTAFEHQQACEQIVKDTWMHLSGWNNEELEQGREAVAAALADLPNSASQRERERKRDAALAPTQAAIVSQYPFPKNEPTAELSLTRHHNANAKTH